MTFNYCSKKFECAPTTGVSISGFSRNDLGKRRLRCEGGCVGSTAKYRPERHWDVNSTAGTNVRYASSKAIQNESFHYFNSSQGSTFPAAQALKVLIALSGAENPAMASLPQPVQVALNLLNNQARIILY
ncbi:hypothetical protein CEXT_274111 [Caerostris extrusa]|uniref:Uncharacterized protein n=1 Tax=Caerostris extrusa TaxID=172846 RepID=A0AAV4NYN1_CAEEX|nr:hypothetical protein CEXT_274111 [Caerostris extrusa]